MLLKYFYDDALAHASYLVGCQRTGEALIVDPGRDIERYLEAAKREGMRIVGVAETHIHADYVSGARELADRIGAKLYVSDEGTAEWKYEYAHDYDAQLLHDRDSFRVGNVKFDVLHTPGHTPESISFLLTDQGGGAEEPMGIFTGDFVFVGSIGRPDLLEQAAGMVGTAESGARQLFQSVQRFRALPDYLQIWPAHGAGSACGKGLGAVPSSTVGYEKLFNPALQIHDEQAFVRYILADQPEAPKYFALMKQVNKQGPAILGPNSRLAQLSPDQLNDAIQTAQVIDLAPPSLFAEAHVPGSINMPVGMLAAWAGWLLDYERPIYFIGSESQLPEAVRVLHKIGVDHVQGYFDHEAVSKAGLKSQSYRSATPSELQPEIASGEFTLVDVRGQTEWDAGHIQGARHIFLGKLPDRIHELKGVETIVAQCKAGGRSAIATSYLQAAGFHVINMTGGITAWENCGFDTTCPATQAEEPTRSACQTGR